jgi:peptide-N4-(N-acetyl-beta-glucosaminyl)asparagine amidase
LSTGWKYKLSYCIAFSVDGATDVTRRYVRNAAAHGADRKSCPEEVLLYIINEIRRMRRENLTKEEKRRLIKEDDMEERELRGYVVLALTSELERQIMTPGGRSSSPASENKHAEQRAANAAATQQGQTWTGGPRPGEPGSGQPPREGH